MWESTIFKHPSTFDTLAMNSQLKQSIVEDLDLFANRKGYLDKVGRAWKRGYLLYGPPGTGRSYLVAAIANYIRAKVSHDCRHIPNSDSQDDDQSANKMFMEPGAKLSGLLNFIDGLWSSCGEERIISFTTNHKDRLDPALLRPGRMDVHIEMGYCTPGFKKLANTNLGIKDHNLFESIEDPIQRTAVTPAELAQHLMKSEDPEIALGSLIEFLNMKKNEHEEKGNKKEETEVIKEEHVKKENECQELDKRDHAKMIQNGHSANVY